MKSAELKIFDEKIAEQTATLELWRRPSESLLFETLRAIDHAYCEELFVPDTEIDSGALLYRSLLTWGVNKVLARMMPDELLHGPFRFFPSNDGTQQKADWFLLQCGILERAELLRNWLFEGLVSARLDVPPKQSELIKNILVLKTAHPSLFQEVVSVTQRRFMSEFFRDQDRNWENDLERRHMEMLPELEKRVDKFRGWSIAYSTNDEIDRYFLEWGQIYLRRMWSQDTIGSDEKIGGHQFNEYLGVLAALSGRSQKHLCYASILKGRHPELDIRNLLTTFCSYEEFLVLLSRHLDADTLQVQQLLASLTLEPLNKASHLGSASTAWAPVVRATHEYCILPMYGMEMNPFLFLLTDLQTKYPKDWFEAANNREKRWLTELKSVFQAHRWQISDRNFALRDGGRVVTDVDFLAYDRTSNEIAMFQLKWQQPVGIDTRARRSAAKNLVTEGNRWIAAVHAWLDQHGLDEFSRRAGMSVKPGVQAELFVLARYNALFPGVATRDERATWADWNHLLKVFGQNLRCSPKQLAELLDAEADRIQSLFQGESYFLPLSDLSIVLNPTLEPFRPHQPQ